MSSGMPETRIHKYFFSPYHSFISQQTERAYQKQPPIFQNKKRVLSLGEPVKKKELRYYKNVGLGFKTPKEVAFKS